MTTRKSIRWTTAVLFCATFLLLVMAALASMPTAQAEISGDYTYIVSDGKATITDFNTTISGTVTIPATLGGYPVTSIGDDAFRGCTGLTSITIPDSVTDIGDYAFRYCAGLTNITIPDSVTSIGYRAFDCCMGLTSVYITDMAAWCGITFDGLFANPLECANSLYLNGSLVTDLVIPDSVTSIGGGAFRDCTGLTSVTIPDSVTSIGGGAFRDCTGLTSVTIPDSVTSIGGGAFDGCTGLTSITIPDSVTSIGNNAFSYCTGLTSITIGGSVTSIGRWAFDGCTGLTKITLPFVGNTLDGTSNTYFGYIFGASSYEDNSEYVPSSLKEVVITKATSIGDDAFRGCTGLTSITIPDSVTDIGDYAFRYCTGLTNVYYQGTCMQRKRVSVGGKNEPLLEAAWQYASVLPSDHVYTDANDTTCNVCGAARVVEPPELTSVVVTKKPTKVDYLEGDSFDKSGMVVTVTYANGASETVTDYTVSADLSAPGTKTVTVAYGDKTATFTVTVEKATVPSAATTTTATPSTGTTATVPAETDAPDVSDASTQPNAETSVTTTGAGTTDAGQVRDDTAVQDGALPWVFVAVAVCVLIVVAGSVAIIVKKKKS